MSNTTTQTNIETTLPVTMRAALVERFGPPEVMEIKEIPIPDIADDEVLVKVHATSINTADTASRSGALLPRLFGAGLRRPKKPLEGSDLAGEVVAVGKDITKFRVGDRVFGGGRSGSFAQYARGSERGLVPLPDRVSFVQGGGVFVAALTAVQYMRDLGKIQSGQHILINGASGGIGTFAVQYAKLHDLEITAVCSSKNQQLVEQLGADHFIDYTKQDFTKLDTKYDLIFDTVGKIPFSKWKRGLTKDGVFINSGSPSMNFIRLLLAVMGNRFRSKKMKFTVAQMSVDDMTELGQLMAEGKMKTVVDTIYPFEQIVKAVKHYENGHATGKIIVQMIEETK